MTDEIYVKELEREYEALVDDYESVIALLVARDEEICRLRVTIALLRNKEGN